MKRTRLRSMSDKKRAALATTPQKPRTPLPTTGKRAWAPTEPAGVGLCIYRGPHCTAAESPGPLTWEHTIQRSLNPGPLRDDPRLLARVCWPCNSDRAAGWKPAWLALPTVTRDLILELKGERFAHRYYAWL